MSYLSEGMDWQGMAKDCQSELIAKDSRIAELERERDALGRQLEADRTAVADCLTAANKAIDSRHWLTEGRGSYEWNDDRWHDEFQAAALEIKQRLAPLTAIAANWKGCPQATEAIAQARINLEKERDSAQALLRDAVGALATISTQHQEYSNREGCSDHDMAYSMGVTDGHRCAAGIARAFLSRPEVKAMGGRG